MTRSRDSGNFGKGAGWRVGCGRQMWLSAIRRRSRC